MLSSVVLPAALFGLFAGMLVDVLVPRISSGEGPVISRLRLPLVGVLFRPVTSRLAGLSSELSCAALCALVAWRFPGPQLLPLLYLVPVGVLLARLDVRLLRLPNVVVLPSYGIVGALLLAASALSSEWVSLGRAMAGGLLLFGLYYLVFRSRPGGMGAGDVKLAGVLGMVLGWFSVEVFVVGALLAFPLGALFTLPLALSRRYEVKVPFGPFMLAAALLGLLWGPLLFEGYFSLLSSFTSGVLR